MERIFPGKEGFISNNQNAGHLLAEAHMLFLMRAADTTLFYLRFPSLSNNWTIAKRHHPHTPGCLNDLQTELQLRAAITISQQIIYNTRSVQTMYYSL